MRKNKTRIQFRVSKADEQFDWDEVIAILVDSADDCNNNCLMSYAHIGQHSEASVDWVNEQPLASKEEYTYLLDELIDVVGYDVEVVV